MPFDSIVRVRVKDNVTGHEYTVAESAVDPERHTVVDKPAVDSSGDSLPDKPNVSKGAAKSTRDKSAVPSQSSTPASEPTTKE